MMMMGCRSLRALRTRVLPAGPAGARLCVAALQLWQLCRRHHRPRSRVGRSARSSPRPRDVKLLLSISVSGALLAACTPTHIARSARFLPREIVHRRNQGISERLRLPRGCSRTATWLRPKWLWTHTHSLTHARVYVHTHTLDHALSLDLYLSLKHTHTHLQTHV